MKRKTIISNVCKKISITLSRRRNFSNVLVVRTRSRKTIMVKHQTENTYNRIRNPHQKLRTRARFYLHSHTVANTSIFHLSTPLHSIPPFTIALHGYARFTSLLFLQFSLLVFIFIFNSDLIVLNRNSLQIQTISLSVTVLTVSCSSYRCTMVVGR